MSISPSCQFTEKLEDAKEVIRSRKSKKNQLPLLCQLHILYLLGGRRGRDRMVVGFTTTYAISAHHH